MLSQSSQGICYSGSVSSESSSQFLKAPGSAPGVRHYFSLSLYGRHPLENDWIPNKKTKNFKQQLKKKSTSTMLTGPTKLFSNIYQNMDQVKDKNKSLNLEEIVDALKVQVIPFDYFGSHVNEKLFFGIVNRMVKQTLKECIHETQLYQNYEYVYISWLKNSKEEDKREILRKANIMLLQTVVKPLIRHYYVCHPGRDRSMIFVLRAIKLDLQDAFGNTDLTQLWAVIRNDKEILSDADKTFLFKHIFNQHVKVSGGGRKVFKWNHGLLQGDRLSSVLCELYLTDMENKKMMTFLKAPHSIFYRNVDDILFVTTVGSRIFDFENCASQIYILNENKTVKYIDEDDDPCIPYLGKVFNVETREVSKFYYFEKGTQLTAKFKIWKMTNQFSTDNMIMFVRSSMQFSNSNTSFSRYELNSSTNSPERIVQNIFEGMCLVAFKLHSVFKSVMYAFNFDQPFVDVVIQIAGDILILYSRIIHRTVQTYKGEKYKDSLCMRLIRWVILRAFLLVFKRAKRTYMVVIEKMQKSLEHYYIKLKRAELNIEPKYFVTLPDVFKHLKL